MTCDVSQLWRHKRLSKYIACDCGVFIAVSNGMKTMKIHQEMQEL